MNDFNIKDSGTIHSGVDYDRIEHVEREEDIYFNPSNAWRVAECPASARKINSAANIRPEAFAGLSVDKLVHNAMIKQTRVSEVAPSDTDPELLRQAELYFSALLQVMKWNAPGHAGFEVVLEGDYVPHFMGIADSVVYSYKTQTLTVIDHKTGTNTKYQPDMLQLHCYAVMAARMYQRAGKPLRNISLMVLQPEMPDPKQRCQVQSYDVSILDKWDSEIRGIVQYARDHPDEANPGLYRCLLCPHQKGCKALKQYDAEHGGEFTDYKARVLKKFH